MSCRRSKHNFNNHGDYQMTKLEDCHPLGNLLVDEFWCHCGKTLHSEKEAWNHVKKTNHKTMRRNMIQKVRFII